MTLTFRHRKQEARDVFSFFFEPQEPLAWLAGQSIKIELPGEYGPIERRFTISAAPSEKLVRITTRLSHSDFKQTLYALAPGTKVTAYAIEGKVTWAQSKLPKVFIAAGIGITPYRSMLAERAATGKSLDTTLIYGDSETEIIFKSELDALTQTHPEFKVIYEIGRRLSAEFISQHCDIKNSLIYISGPSQMVDDLSDDLLKHGARQENLVCDWFTGKF